jgi:hypothetical protein
MLVSAVLVGVLIVRRHSRRPSGFGETGS